jgi:glycosyltransferase involved in cell wall biosynthesis
MREPAFFVGRGWTSMGQAAHLVATFTHRAMRLPLGKVDASGTGWLVPADDQQALVKALLAAASDPRERRRRGERAHLHSRSRYGWPAIATHTADIYDKLSRGLGAQPSAPA